MYRLLILILLMAAFLSCGEDNFDDTQDTNAAVNGGNASYSGITEVGEGMHIKSVDLDDWRDDGILSDCIAYPNPIKQTPVCLTWYDPHGGVTRPILLKVRYKTSSYAHVGVIVRDSSGKIVPQVLSEDINIFTFSPASPSQDEGTLGAETAEFVLCVVRNDEYEPLKPGLYRFFIYGSESLVTVKTLQGTGVINASRDKYSMVYGDVLIVE